MIQTPVDSLRQLLRRYKHLSPIRLVEEIGIGEKSLNLLWRAEENVQLRNNSRWRVRRDAIGQ